MGKQSAYPTYNPTGNKSAGGGIAADKDHSAVKRWLFRGESNVLSTVSDGSISANPPRA